MAKYISFIRGDTFCNIIFGMFAYLMIIVFCVCTIVYIYECVCFVLIKIP